MQRALGARVAPEAGPVTRGMARTSSTGVAAVVARKVSHPAFSGAKSPGRSRATAASGGDADAASPANAVDEVGAPRRARAVANKRVTFQLSEYELKASRVLELWRLTLNEIGARRRLVEAEETDEASADDEVNAEDDEMAIVDAVVVDDSDPTWDPAGLIVQCERD